VSAPTASGTVVPSGSSGAPAPTEAPGSSSAPGAPSATAAPAPPAGSANPGASAEPGTPAPGSSFAPTVSASPIAPGTPEPTAAATLAIISNVIVVGETAAYSPDGTMLAFSARPADGSHGPDIYLWHAGDPSAEPVTFDHASTFSGWWGSTLIGSRAVPVDTDTDVTPNSSAGDSPVPSTAVSAAPAASAGGQGGEPGQGTSPSGSGPGFAVNPTASGSVGKFVVPVAGTPRTTTLRQFSDFLAMVVGLLSGGVAFPANGPATGPAVAPAPAGAATSSAAAGPAGAAPASSEPPSAEPSEPASNLPGEAPNASPAASAAGTDTASQAIPESFLIDTTTGAETQITALPAWRPVVDPTGRFAVYWNGTLRYDAPTVSWVPDRGQLFVASWPALTGSDPTAQLVPTPLLAGDPDGTPSGDWDIRWDATGQRLAIWIADTADANIGRLTLLTIDGATGAPTPNGLLLQDAPAQPGFSLGSDRLAWATPPGQDGEGSRLQILAWAGQNAGKIDSEPASGPDAVIVVR